MLSAITTKILPATNTRGTRVKATAARVGLIRAWDYELSAEQNHHAAARELWASLGWHSIGPLLGGCPGNGNYVWVMDNPASRLP